MQVQRKRKQVQRKQVQRKQVGIGRHRERCSIVLKRQGQSKRGRGRQSKEKKNKIEIFNLQAREQWSNRPNLPILVVG